MSAACEVRLTVSAAQRLQADQLPIPEAVPSKSSIAQATDVVTDGGGVKGGEFSISDSDKVQGCPGYILHCIPLCFVAGMSLHDKLQMVLLPSVCARLDAPASMLDQLFAACDITLVWDLSKTLDAASVPCLAQSVQSIACMRACNKSSTRCTQCQLSAFQTLC